MWISKIYGMQQPQEQPLKGNQDNKSKKKNHWIPLQHKNKSYTVTLGKVENELTP